MTLTAALVCMPASPKIEAIKSADLVILHTEWNDFKSINFKKFHPSKNLKIYDMRNIYSPSKIKSQGFKYFGIGR